MYDSILNKTLISYKTNPIIGGVAPSDYLGKLEAGNGSTPAIAPTTLDGFLASHPIDSALPCKDDLDAFMADRQKKPLALIEKATGKAVYSGNMPEEGEKIDKYDEGEEQFSAAQADRSLAFRAFIC